MTTTEMGSFFEFTAESFTRADAMRDSTVIAPTGL